MVLGNENIDYRLWESCDLITGGLGNFNLENLLRFSRTQYFIWLRLKGEGRVGRYFASKKVEGTMSPLNHFYHQII